MKVKSKNSKFDGNNFNKLFGATVTARDIDDGIKAKAFNISYESLNGVLSTNDPTISNTEFDGYDQFFVLREKGIESETTARLQFAGYANNEIPKINYVMGITK